MGHGGTRANHSYFTLDENTDRTPEELLAIAVLSRAIRDSLEDISLIDTEKGRSKAVRSAESWLYSDSHEPYSFRWICETLCIEPKKVLKFCDEVREDPEYEEVINCNLKLFKSKIGDHRVRTRTGYLLRNLSDKKKAPRGAL